MKEAKRILKPTVYLAPIVFMLVFAPSVSLAVFVVVLLPGYCLTELCFCETKTTVPEKVILSVGIGLTVLAFLVYVLSYLNLPFNAYIVLIYILSTSAAFLIKMRPDPRKVASDLKKPSTTTCILCLIFLVSLVARVYPVLDMNAPLFADPAVQGTITRLVVENQGIPETWSPYLPIQLNHQPGFASVITSLSFISDIRIGKLILIFTNFIHALAPLAIYPFAKIVFGDERRALVTTILFAAATFPTYTFFAGMNSGVLAMFLVPPGAFLAVKSMENMNQVPLILLLFVFSVGAVLVHPLYLFFFVLFIVPYIIYRQIEQKKPEAKNSIIILIMSVAMPFLFVIPHFSGAMETSELAEKQWENQANLINPRGEVHPSFFVEPVYVMYGNFGSWYEYPTFSELFKNTPALVLALLFFYSIYMVLKKRNVFGLLLLSWYILFLGFSTVQSALQVRFPGWQFIYPSRVKFLIGIPISFVLASTFGDNLEGHDVKISQHISGKLLVVLLASAVSISYMFIYMTYFSERTVVSDDDLEAFDWVEKNVADENVVLNPISNVETGAFIGGPGQWIPAETDKRVLYPANSLTGDYERVKDRTEVMEFIDRGGVEEEEFLEELGRYNITHIYISENRMSSRRKYEWPEPELLEGSEYYEAVFANDDVKIFEVTG